MWGHRYGLKLTLGEGTGLRAQTWAETDTKGGNWSEDEGSHTLRSLLWDASQSLINFYRGKTAMV